jgi:GAF domain-containing protein
MRHTTREFQLAAALVETADTLVEGFEPEPYLQRVADHCVALLPAWAAGVTLVDDEGRTSSLVAGEQHREAALDLLKAQRGDGPGRESCVSGRPVGPVPIAAAGTAARWPVFTARALRHGIAAAFAVPLRRHDRLLGALSVFGAAAPPPAADPKDGAGPPPELLVAQALADAAALGLANHRAFSEYRVLSGQLQHALSSRVRLEQAKGMLAERWRVSPDEAFARLRRYVRSHRLPLDRVAGAVVERLSGAGEPDWGPDGEKGPREPPGPAGPGRGPR